MTRARSATTILRRPRVGSSLRVGLASFFLVPLLSLALVVGNTPAASALTVDPPCHVMAAGVSGALAIGGKSGVLKAAPVAGAAAAEGAVATGVSSVSASALIGGFAAFGASMCGTSAFLHWVFDSPEQPGAQPNTNAAGNYTTMAAGNGTPGVAYDALGSGTWRSFGTCRAGSAPGNFDATAAGTYSNAYSTCFSQGNTITSNTTGTVNVNRPSYRCKAAGATQCYDSIKIVFPTSTGLYQGGGQVGPGSAAGPASSVFTTGTMGSSCAGWSGGGYASQAACLDAYKVLGWDLWYDAAKIEFVPPPVRTFKTTRTCRTSTGATSTTTTTSANFYGNEERGLDLAPSTACPSGQTPVSHKIEQCAAAGAAPCEELVSWVAAPRVSNPSASDPWKECLPGGASAPCRLKLYKNTSTGFQLCDRTADCHTFDPSYDWSPNTWKCQWGSLIVGLTDCQPMVQWATGTSVNDAGDPDPAPEKLPATGPNGQPQTGTVPGTGGVPATDPNATPNPSPSGSPSPSPSSPTQPSSGPNPTPGGPEGIPDPDAATDPDSESCLGAAWGWNPVAWVLVPVKCALLWAFVPPEGSLGWESFVETAKARPPASLLIGLGAFATGVADGYSGAGGCGVLAVFDTPGADAVVDCPLLKAAPHYQVLYGVVQASLIASTGFLMLGMVRSAIQPKG